MNDMAKAMIAMQEKALEMQRQQIAMASKFMSAGKDAVLAQKQNMAAFEAGTKAWRSWFELWTPKP
jgi:hypothetical protein